MASRMFDRLHGNKGEQKAEAAVEAAADPNTSVSSADAQKVMADESKRAGITAYSFDPDMSPEEKAAAAGANVPAGFHHESKSKAVGVVSDMDGGPDQYDLPAPTADGVVASPSGEDFPKDSKQPHMQADDKTLYEKTTGWAPKFGTHSMTEDEANESLLDHTTWVESKLDDKFFGDWYHNSAVIVFACVASWVVAIIGGGLGWIFIVMAVCSTYYRTSLRRVRRNFRDDINRELAKTRLETDTESLEWINGFLVKFWPIYAPVIARTVIASVDQVLSTTTPAFLENMRMSFFTLGSKPPRLEHVKTYPKEADDIVLMDWKFSFTPGDKMDMTARQLKEKINPKVVLGIRVGKGIVSKELDVIVEDMAFSGLMRVRVKLQIPFPHIDRVEICFLGRPEIDYICKPIGGDMLGFDINFIPGLEGFIKEQIHANLGPMMYNPNFFPIEVAKMLSGSTVDKAIGVLAITIHGAQGLKNPDKLAGTPDPYCVVMLNGREPQLGKTKIVKENASPRFNETFYVIITSLTDALTIQAFDYNEFRKDKIMGTATWSLDQLEQLDEHENLQLEVLAGGKPRGIIQADVRFFPVLTGVTLDDGTVEPPPVCNTGIATFHVEQAADLDGSKSLVGAFNPYALLLLNGKEIHQTSKLKRTNRPYWSDGHKEFMVTDRKSARLAVVIKDDKDLGGDPILGTYQIKLDDMHRLTEEGKEWYNLSGVKTGRVKLALDWRPVAMKGIVSGSGGYITPIGVLRFHFKNARDLKNVEKVGKSDPYARVLVSGIQRGRTVTFENDLNPNWDQVVYVPVHTTRERITVEVMDEQNIGKDRSLGHIELSAADFVKEGKLAGEYLVYDQKAPRADKLRMSNTSQPKGVLNYDVAFYPVVPTVDPDDETEAEEEAATVNGTNGRPRAGSKNTAHSRTTSLQSVTTPARKSLENGTAIDNANKEQAELGKVDTNTRDQLNAAAAEQASDDIPEIQKIRLTADSLTSHGHSGLLIFKIISGSFGRSDMMLEVLMDDMLFPTYTSAKVQGRSKDFGETGDAVVREIDLSQITLRLVEKADKKGDGEQEHVYAKFTGDLLPILQRCLYTPQELSLKSPDGAINKITVSMKYLPLQMVLGRSERMDNSGSLRIDVLDAEDLPAADRNGYSDPYCKFELNGKTVFKTNKQKKTLHPSWNEFFETQVVSRTAANLVCNVYDWDAAGEDDFLGATKIDLADLEPMTASEVQLPLDGKSGVIRMRLLFKSSYVARTRQGSSTFSGTIGPAGKIIGAPVKGVGKVGTALGGGVVKGASFMKRGFGGGKDAKTPTSDAPMGDEMTNGQTQPAIPTIETPENSTSNSAAFAPDSSLSAFQAPPHARNASSGAFSNKSTPTTPTGLKTSGAVDSGTASISILSASGFPAGAKVQVHVKHLVGGKPKDVLKTKGVKSSGSSPVQWDSTKITRYQCAADGQFQIVVKDDKTFGSDPTLGEALFFVDDSSQGSEREVKVGGGSVMIRSSFQPAEAGSLAPSGSPRMPRRSFLSKRDSRGGTPS